MKEVPVALTIAGSDCSSGAGIQADLKTFQHFHVHGLTAVTCVVSETANIVRARASGAGGHRKRSNLAAARFISRVRGENRHACFRRPCARRRGDPQTTIPTSTGRRSGDDGVHRRPLIEPEADGCLPRTALPARPRDHPEPSGSRGLARRTHHGRSRLESAARRLVRPTSAPPSCSKAAISKDRIVSICWSIRGESTASRRNAFRWPVRTEPAARFPPRSPPHWPDGESLPWAVELAKNYLGETLRQSYEFAFPRRRHHPRAQPRHHPRKKRGVTPRPESVTLLKIFPAHISMPNPLHTLGYRFLNASLKRSARSGTARRSFAPRFHASGRLAEQLLGRGVR